jgi:hypothetical protein
MDEREEDGKNREGKGVAFFLGIVILCIKKNVIRNPKARRAK